MKVTERPRSLDLDIASRIPGVRRVLARPEIVAVVAPMAEHVPAKFVHSIRTGLTAHDAHGTLGNPPEVQWRALLAGVQHDAFQIVSFDPSSDTGYQLKVDERKIEAIKRPGPRTETDRDFIQKHPAEAAGYVSEVQQDPDTGIIIYYHHGFQGPEHSYPQPIDPNQLPSEVVLEAAVLAAADTVDALLHMPERPYPTWKLTQDGNEQQTGQLWTPADVRDELKRKFDPYLDPDQCESVLQAGIVYVGAKRIEDLAFAA